MFLKVGMRIFVLSLVARLVFAWLLPSLPDGAHDSRSWEAIAENLTLGQGFVEDGQPTTVRPPVYPLFLALLYRIFGHSLWIVRLAQILLSSCVPVLLWGAARRLLDDRTAFMAALVCAVLPSQIMYSPLIASETPFTFLLVSSLYFLIKGIEGASLKDFALSGVLLGIAHLCRPTCTYYPFVMILLALLLSRPRREIGGILLATALSFAVVFPWTLRNYRHFGGFFINVGPGQALWLGSQLETEGRYVGREHPSYRQFDHTLNDPIAWEKANMKAAIQNIKSYPWAYVKLTCRKFLRQWFEPVGGNILKEKSKPLFYALSVFHAAFILLAFYGALAGWPLRERLYPLYALILWYGFTHLVIFPLARFRMPFEPVLGFFMVHGVLKALDRFRPRPVPSPI